MGRRHNNRPRGRGSRLNLVGSSRHSRGPTQIGAGATGVGTTGGLDKERRVRSRPRRSRLTPSRSFRA